MDLQPVTTTFPPVDNKMWLGSEHGTDATRTVTLNLAAFTNAAHKTSDGLYLLSGVPIAKITATGLYAPWNNAAADGTQNLLGHLFEMVKINSGATKAGGALLWHGVVVAAKVPGTFDAALAQADIARILYV